MRSNFSALLLAVALCALPVLAHHSFEAEYDSTKTADFTGVVTQIDWQNPHAYVYANVKDPSGTTKNMRFELGPPYALLRGGWKKDTVKIGDTITVTGGALAKDPHNNWVGAVPATTLVLSNGTKLTMR